MNSKSLIMLHLRSNKVSYCIGTILLSISLMIQLLIPSVLEAFTDALQALVLTREDIVKFALWIVAIGLGMAIFRCISRIYIIRLSRVLEKNLRIKLFAHWEKMPASYYNKQRIGDLMSHAINDINVMREVAMAGIMLTIEAFVLIIIAIIAMCILVNPWLTLLVVLPLPGLTYIAYSFRRQIHSRATKVQEAIGQLTSSVQEFCSGIRIIKTYAQEEEETKKFLSDNRLNVEANKSLIHANTQFTSISQGIIGLIFLLSVIFGGLLVLENTITLSEFVAFNTYLGLLIGPVENLGRVINVLQQGGAADVRLRHILSEPPLIEDKLDVLPIKTIQGDVRISNLSFTYPGQRTQALRNINLHLPKGSSLAIVGRVGSGKTTLIQLLMRIYEPPEGTILIDDHDIHRIPLQLLRQSIGYLLQQHFLFPTTISENIAFHPDDYASTQIENAAKMAQVHGNISEFPKRFQTMLGERGMSLSGGQRQRVSIA